MSLGLGVITNETLRVATGRIDKAYSVQFSQSPTANDDCILYIENENSLRKLVIDGIWLQITGAAEVYLKLNDTGTRNAAASITPVNLDATSSESAVGNFEQGVDLDGGTATLSGGTEVIRFIFSGANSSTYYPLNITLGNTLTLWCSDSTQTVKGTVIIHYE